MASFRSLGTVARAARLVPFLVLLAACVPDVVVRVRTGEGLERNWEAVTARHPLPDGLSVVVTAAGGGAAGAIAAGIIELREIEGGYHGDGVVLERGFPAPVVDLWDPQTDVVLDEARTMELVSIGEVRLPLRAVSVDGRYAGEPGYPLERSVVMEARSKEAPESGRRVRARFGEQAALLDEWLERVRAEFAPADGPGPLLTRPPVVRWIGGVGDLMVARGVTELLDRADGLARVFGDVLPVMRGVDLLFGNLEGAVTTRGTPLDKGFTFRFHPRALGHLERAGFDYLGIVNNHSFDYGLTGFLDTLDHLAASPIVTSGAGRTLEEASQPWAVALDGGTSTLEVRVLSMGAYPLERSGYDGARTTAAGPDRPGVLWADSRNPAAQADAFAALEAAASAAPATEGDGPVPEPPIRPFTVVFVHGGEEWALRPSEPQRALYRRFIDSGADLVLGHHSHVVQGLEAYQGGLIAYSLGNFIFPGMYETDYGEESLLLRVGVVDGAIRYVEPVPVRIDHQVVSIDRTGVILERLRAETRRLH